MLMTLHLAVPIIAFMAGILNGLGGSGGVVFMSVLMMLGFSPVSATAVNKATAIFGSLGGLINFFKDKKMILSLSFSLIICSIIGAIIGALFAVLIPEKQLGRIFPFLILFFIFLDFTKNYFKNKSFLVSRKYSQLTKNSISLFSGFYNGIFGPGTLMLTSLPLHMFIGMSMIDGLAIATFLNAVSNFTACIAFSTSLSDIFIVPISILLSAMLANFLGQYVGSKISIRHGDKILRFVTLISMSVLFIYLTYKYWFS